MDFTQKAELERVLEIRIGGPDTVDCRSRSSVVGQQQYSHSGILIKGRQVGPNDR